MPKNWHNKISRPHGNGYTQLRRAVYFIKTELAKLIASIILNTRSKLFFKAVFALRIACSTRK